MTDEWTVNDAGAENVWHNDTSSRRRPRIERFRKGTAEARVIEVIESTHTVGDGTHEYPYRKVISYHTLDGQLLAERDDWKDPAPTDLRPHGSQFVARPHFTAGDAS